MLDLDEGVPEPRADGSKEELRFGGARTGVALLHGHPPPAQPRAEQLVLDRMWSEGLPTLQQQADQAGYGLEWRAMCETRTATVVLAAGRGGGGGRPRRRQRQPRRRSGLPGSPQAPRERSCLPPGASTRAPPVGCRILRSYRSPSDGKSPLRGSEGLPAGFSGREKVRKSVP